MNFIKINNINSYFKIKNWHFLIIGSIIRVIIIKKEEFMEYVELEKLYYKRKNVKEEYEKRFNNYCTIKTNLFISPLVRGEKKNKEKYELFLLPLNKLLILQNKITENSKKIKSITESISNFAVHSCILDLVGKEIIKTNEIEGVHSTKKEVFDEINFNKKSKDTQIIQTYLDLLNEKYTNIDDLSGIKKLYDKMFDQNVLEKENNKVEGKFVRQNSVSIYNGDKKIHVGINGEENIEKNMESLIVFMNNKQILPLIKAAITHYFLEYIHPFYDGNGRFGRYIYSMYLSRKFDIFTGISLSYSIKMNNKIYLDSFLQVGKKENYGEITFFVENVLKIIAQGQESIIELLEKKKIIYEFMYEKIKELELEENEENILICLCEMKLFSKNIAVKHNDLTTNLNISSYKLKNNIENLIKEGYIIKIRKKPLIYALGEKIEDLID